ncbi:MAG: peptidoglycan editing factor PgeF [Candidatus Berkiella sp.]
MQGILPLWPAPTWVRALTTTVEFGNLATHVEDDPHHVARNRQQLIQALHLKHEPVWLKQTHSTKVVEVTHRSHQDSEADGSFTTEQGVPCVVLTADCLPLLLCDTDGTVVGAVHCGWRGIQAGIIEKAVTEMANYAKSDIIAWMGPAIGQQAYEVGQEVYDIFVGDDKAASYAFKATINPGKYLMDMEHLARQRLKVSGVTGIYGGGHCTYTEKDRFYSYRRNKATGRMATLIWLDS